MKRLNFIVASLLLLLIWQNSSAQEPSKWAAGGYLKYMQTISIQDWDNITADNLFHHRLNVQYFPSDKITIKAGWRNRLIYGDTPRQYSSLGSSYAQIIDAAANDVVDLSAIVVEKDPFFIHTIVDRLYIDYAKDKWQISLGRQRINWGINLAWNPNDLFNAYSFFDFDYEERPGSDALRIQYFPSYTSSVEFAVKTASKKEEIVAAALWKTNKWTYDFQFLAGLYQEDLVFGGGWAGNLKNAGFKGEWSLFTPLEKDSLNKTSFTGAVSIDYVFSNNTFATASYLYNSGAGQESIFSLIATDINAKNIFPFKHSLLVLATYPVSDRTNASLSSIFSPGDLDLLFVNPSLSYSVKDNWDLDFIGQLAFARIVNYEDLIKSFYLRLKCSY